MNKISLTFMAALISLIVVPKAYAQSPSDYLVCQDIGGFKKYGCACGSGAGELSATGHFGKDHADISCTVIYHNMTQRLAVDVEVTQHAGADSDKWLLHEMDSAFRDKFGIPAVSYYPWLIEGQTIFIDAVGGREYRWLSGNKVVMIEYHGSMVTTPEPIEVVKAYLTKHPSTIPATTLSQLRSADSKIAWIKDEMDRRLWLADKWFAQIQTPDPKLGDKLKSTTDSMVVFLNYREKYYNVASRNEKIALETALSQNNVSAVQAKLTEYKTWWTEHKADSITLP